MASTCMHQVKLMHVLSDEHVCWFEYICVVYTLVYLPACVCVGMHLLASVDIYMHVFSTLDGLGQFC